jgi:CRP/FNR family transcriptional regulator/CRP/FNR family cyclic AMP-dependent transcriptional regulator
MTQILRFLRSISLFSSLNEKDLKEISKVAEKRNYDNGDTVIHQGDIGNSLYIVIKGKLKAILKDGTKEIILKTLDSGEYFGELSLFGNNKRASYVKAITKSELLMFHKKNVIEMIYKHPVIAINLLGEVCNRLAATDEQLGSIVFTDVKERIIRTLINLFKNASKDKSGQKIIKGISITNIAGMTGTGRPTASKIINDLKRNGYINIQKKTITLLRNDLEDMCN